MCSLRMTSPFRIVIIATRHISRALSSLRNALPLPTNTLLYFPLADQRPAYLWPVQAQHRYGAARLLFANHHLDFSSLCLAIAQRNYLGNALLVRFYAITYRFLSTPKQFQTYLFDSVPSLIFATLALANPHNALLMRFYASLRFTSCKAGQRLAIASPIDATRCLCFSLPHHAPLLLCALARVNAC